eukprot:INCI16152.3.p1 GENE.INCI16152.3~~INCI16152.3.p1  ORF type:complete len:381 (+),score=67.80 INCI16152.3:395-1537(+)
MSRCTVMKVRRPTRIRHPVKAFVAGAASRLGDETTFCRKLEASTARSKSPKLAKRKCSSPASSSSSSSSNVKKKTKTTQQTKKKKKNQNKKPHVPPLAARASSPRLTGSNGSQAEDAEATLVAGDRIEVLWANVKTWYAGTIVAAHADGSFRIAYDDGDAEHQVDASRIRRLNEMNIKKVAALQKVGGVLNIAGPPVYVPKRAQPWTMLGSGAIIAFLWKDGSGSVWYTANVLRKHKTSWGGWRVKWDIDGSDNDVQLPAKSYGSLWRLLQRPPPKRRIKAQTTTSSAATATRASTKQRSDQSQTPSNDETVNAASSTPLSTYELARLQRISTNEAHLRSMLGDHIMPSARSRSAAQPVQVWLCSTFSCIAIVCAFVDFY